MDENKEKAHTVTSQWGLLVFISQPRQTFLKSTFFFPCLQVQLQPPCTQASCNASSDLWQTAWTQWNHLEQSPPAGQAACLWQLQPHTRRLKPHQFVTAVCEDSRPCKQFQVNIPNPRTRLLWAFPHTGQCREGSPMLDRDSIPAAGELGHHSAEEWAARSCRWAGSGWMDAHNDPAPKNAGK